MTTHYQQISITVTEQEMKDILVAILADAGYEGFVENRTELQAFIPSQDFSDAELASLLSPFGLGYEKSVIEQRNWNAEWEAGFQPVQVGTFCYIRADFHPAIDGFQHDLVITPKMSFGTGHHATTHQMVAAMETMDFTNKAVLDFGTGTGILAILAHQLGAAWVSAIDNDYWSIENTLENIARNKATKILVKQADNLDAESSFDIILANINKHVVIGQMQAMVSHLNPGGQILISGLLESDSADLQAAIDSCALTLKRKENRDSWLCWLVQRT